MDKEKALSFLKENQPMPNDKNLNESLISMYDEVRRYFLANPDEECLPLFLNSFGEYGGMGVYQLVEDVILKFKHDKVVSCLLDALKSKFNGVKYWCAQICALFPDEKLITPLEKLLNDSSQDIRMSVITSLSQIQDEKVITILKNQLSVEEDDEVKDFLIDVIEDVEGNI
ncbi:HEAT repeat domain-containing protein [Clostridium manihotivorum]|uniref:HEAT repeat domain-containing protein n=1 Tax=Clostridium manihotivorum TaxID=2320868 RepID=A0A410DXI5_9CLOT|nr:HEAT repeat domain-containing protein [Clostridium manihotivorum]QAA33814.1 HEAT repeat domain-containing protein [Clostridium manihotivorum]